MSWPPTIPPARVDTDLAVPDVHSGDHTAMSVALTELVAVAAWRDATLVSSGELAVDRSLESAALAPTTSGTLRLTYFTARWSQAITQIRTRTISGGAAGATPTLCRVGLYSIAANGDGTLVANIANDSSLWAAASTDYTRSLAATWNKVAGQRYAWAPLIVTGAALPQLTAVPTGSSSTNANAAPRLVGLLTGQTDLPGSFLGSAIVGATHNMGQLAMIP